MTSCAEDPYWFDAVAEFLGPAYLRNACTAGRHGRPAAETATASLIAHATDRQATLGVGVNVQGTFRHRREDRVATDTQERQLAGGSPVVVPAASRSRMRSTGVGLLVVFAVSILVYWISPVRMQTDSFWVSMTARSLVREGNVDLDEYHALIRVNHSFQIERRDGHAYYAVPLGASLAAVPVVAVASLLGGDKLDANLARRDNQPWDGMSAALIVAATVAVMFAIARRLSSRLWVAYATAFAFAFGTQAWGIASRTMWMQAPSMLCMALALLFALKSVSSPRYFTALGAVLALGYFVRPTNAVPLVAFAVWVLVKHRAFVTRYVVGASVVALAFLAANLALYGQLLQPYFRASRLAITPTAAQALLANLVSPSRGILIFVPVTVLAALGFRRVPGGHAHVARRAHRRDDRWLLDRRLALSRLDRRMVVRAALARRRGAPDGVVLASDLRSTGAFAQHGSHRSGGAAGGAQRRHSGSWCFAERTATWNWEPRFLDPARVRDWSDPQFLA